MRFPKTLRDIVSKPTSPMAHPWSRQEAQDGCAGDVTRDDGQEGPHTGAGPVDGGAAVCGQDGATPPWLLPLLL